MMSCSAMPPSHVSDATQESPQPKSRGRDLYKCETTADGDVRTFIVEPSFDADDNSSRQKEEGAKKEDDSSPTSQGAQSRSDEDDQAPSDHEKRSSPSKDHQRTHNRNLSAHFLDATKISDGHQASFPVQHSKQPSLSSASSPFPSRRIPRGSPPPASEGAISYSIGAHPPPISPAAHIGEKHRRGISGDMSSPAIAHRRINSIGNSAPVDRRYGAQYKHYNAPHDRQGLFPVPAARQPTGAHHEREGSAGLDMLSAAIADVSKEELAGIAGPRNRQAVPQTPWEPPVESSQGSRKAPTETLRVSPTPGNSGSYDYPPPQPHQGGPPPGGRGYHYSPHPSHNGFHGSSAPANQGPPYPSGPYHPHGAYYAPPQYNHHRMSPSPTMTYPVQYSQSRGGSSDPYGKQQMPMQPVVSRNAPMSSNGRQPSPNDNPHNEQINTGERLYMRGTPPPSIAPPQSAEWGRPSSRGGTTTGVQTHVTAISVGSDGKTMQPTLPQRTAGTNTDPATMHSHPAQSIPSTVGHHRKMSSFSSLGFMGPGFFPESSDAQSAGKPGPHHRTMSSTAMFLQALDETDPFLHSLNAAPPSSNGQPTPQFAPQQNRYAMSPTGTHNTQFSAQEPVESSESSTAQFSGRALASGGTSKRIRRKCTVANCPNRVVQGGLCISHGAKRKQCKHPGCTKNVKKAGLCSTHGPARKRCDTEGCSKVAVQGGKCIAHGAKKKLCEMDGCTKQAILSGMCKKHHDQKHGLSSSRGGRKQNRNRSASASPQMCMPIDQHSGPTPEMRPASSIPKSNHRRGLSIFQEMSADSVKILLSDEVPPAQPESIGRQPGMDAFGSF